MRGAWTTRPSTSAGGAAQHEVGERGRVGRDHALDRRVRDVALVPQRHVLQRRHGVAAQQARQAGQVLAQDRVLLVRHRRGALLPLAERLLRFADLGALPVADLDARASRPTAPTSASASKSSAWRSRCTICVATVSGAQAERGERFGSRPSATRWRRCRRRRRSCRPRSIARAATQAARGCAAPRRRSRRTRSRA